MLSLRSKLQSNVALYTKDNVPVTVPQYTRFLRFPVVDASPNGGGPEEHNHKRRCQKGDLTDAGDFKSEVVFGIPWAPVVSIAQAGHPSTRAMGTEIGCGKAYGVE